MFEQRRKGLGLTAYARVRRFRPILGGLTVFEGLLSLMGVALISLFLMTGSFGKAGSAIDATISGLSALIGL